LDLPGAPCWLDQVHGAGVVELERTLARPARADAAVARHRGVVCAVMTADCLPVLFCSRQGDVVAAAHAGWRGLLAGVLSATVRSMATRPGEILAWLGPAIGPERYEVDADFRQRFLDDSPLDPDRLQGAFRAGRPGHFQANLYDLARLELESLGISTTYGGGLCTHSDPARFYSHRRDGQTGRFATLIWLTE